MKFKISEWRTLLLKMLSQTVNENINASDNKKSIHKLSQFVQFKNQFFIISCYSYFLFKFHF